MRKTPLLIASLAAVGIAAALWNFGAPAPRDPARVESSTPDMAHDTSGRLAPPDTDADADADADDPDAAVQERGTPPPIPVISVPAGSAAVEQTKGGDEAAARLVESFDGLGAGFVGPQGTGNSGNPSDNSLAVGPNHIMQTVNGFGMAIYTKKGMRYDTTGTVLYGPVNVRNVFRGFTGNCEARSSGDVVVRYDQLADRWLVVMPLFSRGRARDDQPTPQTPGDGARRSVPGVEGQPGKAEALFQPLPPSVEPRGAGATTQRGGAGAPGQPPGAGRAEQPQGPYSMCYAVSTSPDPLGSYYRYEFLRHYFPDYPRPAVWPDGYYVPTSTSDNRISQTVATQKHACVAERAKMLRGEPASEQCVIIENVNFLNNADMDGKATPPTGAPNIMVAAGGRQLDRIFEDSILNVWQFHVDWKDPSKTSVTGPQAIPVAPYRYLCDGQLTNCVPQADSQRRLDAQGDKIMARVVYRRIGAQESLVAVHSVNTAANAGGVRWYELRVGKNRAVSLHQQATYAPDALFRWLASPAIDRFGNIGIGYSYGGPDTYPGQRFAGRRPNDPKGQLTMKEALLVAGEAPDGRPGPGGQRWEDYAQTAVDPSDDCTIWYVGDYVKKGGTSYTTKIGAFRMPGCR
jgi:hypothetical protein